MEIGILFYILTFLGGILSFFSPCIIPIIPIYFGYLAGSGKKTDCYGNIFYDQKKVFLHTLFFTLGICVSFFILGISFTTLGDIIFTQKDIFSKIGGVIIILLGLFQLNLLKLNFLQRDMRLNYSEKPINPLIAFITGFTFSFAWTPCVGPILSSVLILSSSVSNKLIGNFLILIYSLGFIIPFLLIGIFTTRLLNFFKAKQKFLKYTSKIGGILLITIGLLTFLGYTNKLSTYLVSSTNNVKVGTQQEATFNSDSYKLFDQFGKEHVLSDYKGKTIFLNFWATWCPPCKEEMPYIEKIYKDFGSNEKDIIILGITNPVTEENPYGQDKDINQIKKFIKNGNYTFPTVFDKTGKYFENFKIRAYPTTVIIGADGQIKASIPGAMNEEQMKKLIKSQSSF
ncbi:cytochrome c biogenesis protein/redoxin [uncultured Cetobacterium sp.]|uniref:cytochrome c biogenesis protein/redoxin n=1 Tax=uncultured Cetobacterium sp. TaxID=527638 RepID=UPI00260281DC|nr:cytochrome c biogenesis protein/redoxin [uncultured Cetobacterium sp.]